MARVSFIYQPNWKGLIVKSNAYRDVLFNGNRLMSILDIIANGYDLKN